MFICPLVLLTFSLGTPWLTTLFSYAEALILKIHGHTTVMKSEYLPIISQDGDFLRKERVLLVVITCEVAYRIHSNKRQPRISAHLE